VTGVWHAKALLSLHAALQKIVCCKAADPPGLT